ncbi:MAG: glycosyltransferase [Solirubrobacterales bacterium]
MTVYYALFLFVGLYVLLWSTAWIAGAARFAVDRETRKADSFYEVPDDQLPSVTVLVPAYSEESTIGACLDALREVDYPSLEVIAIDDGSSDQTGRVIKEKLAEDPRLRFLEKRVNEGKAIAMNDALAVTTGEIVVVVDADARIHPHALRFMAAHFVRLPRVGAVTGNPRPINRVNTLTELQVVEYASNVSLMRRSQVVWGRILTMSGVISAFRRSVVAAVGPFDPSMATEDIELTWRIQRRFFDGRYEPRAVIGMVVPETLSDLWRQRIRWARGLVEVLKANPGVLGHWRNRRHWPTYLEAAVSIIWWYLLVFLFLVLVFAEAARAVSTVDLTPIPWGWTAIVLTAAVVQLTFGILLDRKYDRTATSGLAVLPWYPLVYWLVTGIPTAITAVPTLLRRQGRESNVRWEVRRPANPTDR